MKVLFLVWHRSGRNLPGYLDFHPYLYGPCSFELYSLLAAMSRDGFVVQPPHPVQQWAKYYLTNRGRHAAEEAAKTVPPCVFALLNGVVQEVAQLAFSDLLRKVYAEAPDFASRSLMAGILTT